MKRHTEHQKHINSVCSSHCSGIQTRLADLCGSIDGSFSDQVIRAEISQIITYLFQLGTIY